MKGIDKRTCFVRGVPTNVAEEQLLEVFGSIGPVKKCFLVRDKGAEEHKGFGYVTFALPDDASAAVTSLQHHKMDGRKLQVRRSNEFNLIIVNNSRSMEVIRTSTSYLAYDHRCPCCG
jgi:RNA recognition motif-containing protein